MEGRQGLASQFGGLFFEAFSQSRSSVGIEFQSSAGHRAYNFVAMTEQKPPLHASTFQEPLIKLAEVLAQKVKREAPPLLPAPGFVATDLHVLIRQAMHTYNLLFYLNADERRETDCHWRNVYTIISLPLIRNMIDCLYNLTYAQIVS